MSRFDRYMLSRLMMVFGFFALVLISVYWVNSAVRLFDRLISDNQSVWVFLELTALSLPNVIRLMLPVAAFAAVVFTTQRMTGDSELVVMQATGFSPYRLARPVLYFGLIVALLTALLAHLLVPLARTRLNERNSEISENVSQRLLSEGTILHPSPGLMLYIRTISQGGELADVFLSDSRDGRDSMIYTASRAYLTKSATGPKLVMFNGMAQRLNAATRSLSLTRFADFTYDIGSLIAAAGPRYPTLDERMTPALLAPDARLLSETGATRAEALFDGHDRFAKPLLAISGVLIGFAVMLNGTFSRFGLWRQMALGAALYVLQFFLANLSDSAAIKDGFPTAIIYLPAALGTLTALALLVWATRRRRTGRPVPNPPDHDPDRGGMLAT